MPIMGTPIHSDAIADLLFGSVRRDLLALLFGRPDERFYVRELVRAAGGGSGAVQRELKRMAEVGLVRRDVVGRQVYFSANRDAVIFAELQGIVAKTSGVADVMRAELAPLAGDGRVRLAFVHGSVAEGKQTATSDVDLIVVGRAKLADLVPTARAAGARLGRDVNPTVYGLSEFREKSRTAGSFLKRVLRSRMIFVIGDERELARLAR